MAEEVLRISPTKIEVRYVFRNESNIDVVDRMAFPLPPIQLEEPTRPSVFASGENSVLVNPLSFEVEVDGKKIGFSSEVILTTLDASGEKMSYFRIAPEDINKPLNAGVELSGGKISYIYHWRQRFPAGKEVRIVHRYVTSGSTGRFHEAPSVGGDYCFDKAFIRAFANKVDGYIASRNKSSPVASAKDKGKPQLTKEEFFKTHLHFMDANVAYILKTANNWKGPIRTFKLIVDAESPDILVQTCFPGLKKSGKRQYEVVLKDFSPAQDLNLVFFNFDQKNF